MGERREYLCSGTSICSLPHKCHVYDADACGNYSYVIFLLSFVPLHLSTLSSPLPTPERCYPSSLSPPPSPSTLLHTLPLSLLPLSNPPCKHLIDELHPHIVVHEQPAYARHPSQLLHPVCVNVPTRSTISHLSLPLFTSLYLSPSLSPSPSPSLPPPSFLPLPLPFFIPWLTLLFGLDCDDEDLLPHCIPVQLHLSSNHQSKTREGEGEGERRGRGGGEEEKRRKRGIGRRKR